MTEWCLQILHVLRLWKGAGAIERRGQVQVRDMQPPHFDSVLIFGLVMSAASAASVASASAAPAGRFPVRLRPLSTAGK